MVDKIKWRHKQLDSGDRIFICTDGVVELSNDPLLEKEANEKLNASIKSAAPLQDIIQQINNNVSDILKKQRKISPPDDYIILGFELR